MTKTVLSWAFVVVCVIFITWFGVSYVDIIMHNLSGHSSAEWNLFNILLSLKK